MINEFGEEIPEEKVKEISKRVAELSEGKIDKLFKRAGFVVTSYKGKSEKPEKYEALFPGQIGEIKHNKEDSALVENLLLESRKENIIKELESIEEN